MDKAVEVLDKAFRETGFEPYDESTKFGRVQKQMIVAAMENYASQQMPSEEEVLDEAYKRYFSTDNDGGESLISAFSKGVEWFKSLQQEKEWDDNKVIDFVNWYIKLNKLDFRYTLENKNIIDSFKNGDKPEDWHEQPPQEGLHKIECSECGGIFMSPNPKETKCKGCEEGLKK